MQLITQKQNNEKYQKQINSLAQDQHTVGHIDWDNGGYMNAHPAYDITWHYDLQRKKVVVTNIHLTIPSGVAPNIGGGFWDTYVIRRAIDPAPEDDHGTFLWGIEGDVKGVNGNTLKNRYFPGSIGFYSHNNKSQEEVKAINDYHGSYDAVQNPDGSWNLITIYDRSGTSINHYHPTVGMTAWAEWGKTDPVATVTLPKLSTTSIHYHYDVLLNVKNIRTFIANK